ncbi:hypothetical protein HMPREF9004_1808, partial [Schaalia cardiffensis F0333]
LEPQSASSPPTNNHTTRPDTYPHNKQPGSTLTASHFQGLSRVGEYSAATTQTFRTAEPTKQSGRTG